MFISWRPEEPICISCSDNMKMETSSWKVSIVNYYKLYPKKKKKVSSGILKASCPIALLLCVFFFGPLFRKSGQINYQFKQSCNLNACTWRQFECFNFSSIAHHKKPRFGNKISIYALMSVIIKFRMRYTLIFFFAWRTG